MLGLIRQVKSPTITIARRLTLFARRIRTPTKPGRGETVRAYGASPRAAQRSSCANGARARRGRYQPRRRRCAAWLSRLNHRLILNFHGRNGAGDRGVDRERVLAAAARRTAMRRRRSATSGSADAGGVRAGASSGSAQERARRGGASISDYRHQPGDRPAIDHWTVDARCATRGRSSAVKDAALHLLVDVADR